MRAVILTVLLACSCSSNNASETEAQFRFIARGVYAGLYNPSCSAPSGFNRHALLQNEMNVLGDFERETKGTMAAQQLAVARQDVSYEQEIEGRCWADEDIDFAKLHVQMSKKAVRTELPKLRELAGKLRDAEIEQRVESRNRADFRYFAKRLIESARPTCSIGTGKRDDEIMSLARREVDRFHRSLSGGTLVRQFEIAEADVEYLQSITLVECADPSNDTTERLAAQAHKGVRDQLAAIRKTMN